MGTHRQRALLMLCGSLFVGGCDNAPESPHAVTQLPLEQPCDVRQGCSGGDESLAVKLVFSDRPRALQAFPVRVEIENRAPPDSVSVAFSMAGMDMGLNRYRLQQDSNGVWHADVTLPVCISGRSDWLADVDLLYAHSRYRLQVPFVLEK
jgi:hypothetical protein